MYDIDLKNVKKGNSGVIFMILIGLLFAGIGIGMFASTVIKKNRMDSEVEAYKVDINEHYDSDNGTMYSPTHFYVVDGVNYTCSGGGSTGSITSAMRDETVYYNSSDPSDCMTDYSKSTNNLFFIIFTLMGGLVAFLGFASIVKTRKRINKIKYLNQNGKLIKNLPYHMEDTNARVNDRVIQRPVVDYKLPSGSSIKLYGDPRYDNKACDQDGFVDLLIDPNDLNNYFIDFDINRLSGNLGSDYYKPTEEELARMKNNNPNVAQFNNINYNNNNRY